MLVLAIISLIVILFTYLEGKGMMKRGMLLGFILVVAVSAIRYNYGNDYWSYFEKFQTVSTYNSFADVFHRYSGNELAWELINFLFQPLGFYWLIAALSAFNGFVYYKLIREYVDKDKRWFAVFIYLFSNAFFSVQLSMLRQAMAMGLIILSMSALERKQVVQTILLAVSAVLIHTSAVFALPIVVLGYLPFNNGRLVTWILAAFAIVFFVFGDDVLKYSLLLLDSSEMFERYEEKYILGSKYDVSVAKNILGMILLLYPVVIMALHILDKKTTPWIRKLCIISVVGVIISFIAQNIPMAGRMSWYYTVFSIVAIPQSFFSIKNKLVRFIILALFALVTVKEYIGFYTSDTWYMMHYTYHILFELL